jgi:hypothetical protein
METDEPRLLGHGGSSEDTRSMRMDRYIVFKPIYASAALARVLNVVGGEAIHVVDIYGSECIGGNSAKTSVEAMFYAE